MVLRNEIISIVQEKWGIFDPNLNKKHGFGSKIPCFYDGTVIETMCMGDLAMFSTPKF